MTRTTPRSSRALSAAGAGAVAVRLALTLALALALALSLAGCTGDDPEPPEAPSPSAAPAAPEVRTKAALGTVAGRLDRGQRPRVRDQVRRVVDRWIDAAYVGGEYPRTDFRNAWPGFTVDARAQARRAAGLMSNRDIGDKITGVEATVRRLRVDVLAARGRPVGATARVVLRFDTTGERARSYRVAGRLMLTRVKGEWRVFGFDVTKGVVR